jgi:hypothetical protein
MSRTVDASLQIPDRRLVLARWFGDEDRFWSLAAVLLGAIAFMKGRRPPGLFPLDQSQLSYRYGFIKRGLIGSVYDRLGLHHYVALTRIFTFELLALLLLLAWFVYASGLHRRFASAAIAALFASSYAVTFLAHLIGYSDVPLAFGTIALLLIRSPRTRFLLGLLVVPASLLSHEAYLLWLLPLLLLSFVLDAIQSRASVRAATAYILTLGAIALAIALVTSLRPNMTQPQIEAVHRDMTARNDFFILDDSMDVLHRSLADNLRDVAQRHKTLSWRLEMVPSILDLLPVCLLLLHFLRRATRALLAGRSPAVHRRVGFAMAIVLISPLSLHLLGWDAARFNVLFTLVLFLTLLLVCQRLDGLALPLSVSERNAIILVVAFNMATGYGLMNGFQTDPFPFVDRVVSHMH